MGITCSTSSRMKDSIRILPDTSVDFVIGFRAKVAHTHLEFNPLYSGLIQQCDVVGTVIAWW